ncbi:MAG: helix-turn-helix domain-containing protein, partial [Actinomycetota bacterium]|nr:helix-turn-helix domain-containing protein [Actinomycetota bacterium]
MVRESGAVAEMRRALGERLAVHRKAAGLTQAQLASVVFCDRTRLAHLEKGRGSADARFWRTADEALNAAGGLVRAELEFQAAQREQENERRDVELAAIRDQIAEWNTEQATSDGRKPVRAMTMSTDLAPALDWLDGSAGWVPGTARTRVLDRLRDSARPRLEGDVSARARVGRERLANELSRYYGTVELDAGMFVGTVGGHEVVTSILTRQSWTGLAAELTAERETMRLVAGERTRFRLDERGQAAAVRRLAEAELGKVRLTDSPIYRLLSVDIGAGEVSG